MKLACQEMPTLKDIHILERKMIELNNNDNHRNSKNQMMNIAICSTTYHTNFSCLSCTIRRTAL